MECPARPFAVSPSPGVGAGDSGGGDHGLLPQVHFVDSTVEPAGFVPPGHLVAHCKPGHSRVQRVSTNKVRDESLSYISNVSLNM